MDVYPPGVSEDIRAFKRRPERDRFRPLLSETFPELSADAQKLFQEIFKKGLTETIVSVILMPSTETIVSDSLSHTTETIVSVLHESEVYTMKNAITTFEKATGIKLNKYMSGKMEGINCLSTSCLCNPYCAARRNNPDMVCSACFAAGTVARYSSLNQNMMRNTEILTSTLLDINDFPVLNAVVFRLESFGDLVNSMQARNYIRFAKRNPHTQFALWTKNPGILAQAIAVEGKPENLICILSSAYLDKRCDASRWSFIDKTFTVYRPETISRENIDINCGARNCLTCQRCYHKNTETDIREALK